MQATQRSEPKFGLSGICPTASLDERQRPLGKAYCLILSYEPKKQATAQSAIGETDPPPDNTPPAAG
jgi:hypothetical protein